jgi:hypothetical protein
VLVLEPRDDLLGVGPVLGDDPALDARAREPVQPLGRQVGALGDLGELDAGDRPVDASEDRDLLARRRPT